MTEITLASGTFKQVPSVSLLPLFLAVPLVSSPLSEILVNMSFEKCQLIDILDIRQHHEDGFNLQPRRKG